MITASSHLPLSKNAALLKQIRLDRRPIEVRRLAGGKPELQKLSEARRVVVPKSLGVTERLQNRRRLQHPLLQVFVRARGPSRQVPATTTAQVKVELARETLDASRAIVTASP